MEIEGGPVYKLARDRRTDPKEPARHRQRGDHTHEEQVRSLLTTVVTALRRNFNWTERDLEETAGIATEVAEPVDRIAIPFQAGSHDQSKAVRGNHDEAEQVEREHCAENQVNQHGRFGSFIRRIQKVDVHARKEQCEPRDGVERVKNLIRRMKTQNTVWSKGGNIRHEQPPSWLAWNGSRNGCAGARASYDPRA